MVGKSVSVVSVVSSSFYLIDAQRVIPLASTAPIMARGVAPKAMRSPISRVLSSTTKDTTPCTPIAARACNDCEGTHQDQEEALPGQRLPKQGA